MTEQISLQMEGNTCTITIPHDASLRVKVYAPRRQFPVLEGKKTTATMTLFQGETMRVDAYGEGGEGDLLKTAFVLTAQGLVEQKKNLSREVEVVVLPGSEDEEPTTYKTPIPICTECGTPLNNDGQCPVCDDVQVDRPDAPELDDEEISRQEEYLRKTWPDMQEPQFKPMYTIEEVEQLARDDETAPEMYKCPYCQAWHMVQAKEYYCPLDPKARQA